MLEKFVILSIEDWRSWFILSSLSRRRFDLFVRKLVLICYYFHYLWICYCERGVFIGFVIYWDFGFLLWLSTSRFWYRTIAYDHGCLAIVGQILILIIVQYYSSVVFNIVRMWFFTLLSFLCKIYVFICVWFFEFYYLFYDWSWAITYFINYDILQILHAIGILAYSVYLLLVYSILFTSY